MVKIAFRGNIVLPDDIFHQGCVFVEGDYISGIFARKDEFPQEGVKFIDYGDAYIAPGLVDLHLHGASGKDVMDCQIESLRKIAEHQAKNGVTGFLGSTISAPLGSVLDAIHMIKNTEKATFPSEILGVYIEGPFVSTQKKGAHHASFLRGITEKDCDRLTDAVKGLRPILSLAPEVENNMRFIPILKESGFVVAIGHTNATYEQALDSIANGVSLATHLYNAMSGFDHRKPGVVGAVLDSDDITAELIADGVHVHPAALRLAVARKGPEKICLVTDSMMATGVGDGVYEWGDNKIEVKGNVATIRNSGVLAGSVLTLNNAVKNMIEWTDVTINQAINMASLNPARVLGMEDEFGSIQDGRFANLVVLDREFRVLDTILRGKSVLSRIF
jgi:N-acetylglucosamine-6-phosphate deacetylase